MANELAYQEFACVDETHYIHTGDNAEGFPCNSSIGLARDQGIDDSDGWWRCLGCHLWFPIMPKMEPEGLAAIGRMRLDVDTTVQKGS